MMMMGTMMMMMMMIWQWCLFVLQGRGDKSEVDKRVAQLKDEIETSPSEWEKEKLKERLAKLSAGVAAIKAVSLFCYESYLLWSK